MRSKVSFPELVEAVAVAAGTGNRMSEVFLKELFATISQALVEQEKVTLKGVGSFKLSGDNHSVIFESDEALAKAINMPFEQFEAVELDENVTDEMLNDAVSEISDNRELVQEAVSDATPEATPETTPETTTEVSDIVPPPFMARVEEVAEVKVTDELPPPFSPSESNACEAPATPPVIIEPKAEPSEINETPVETEEQNNVFHNNRWTFVRGMLAGAMVAAIVGVTAWWLMSPNTASVPVASNLSDITSTPVEDAPLNQPTAIVTDTTSSTRYLTTIATKHYGRQEFWIYIYKENQDKISDPNNIPAGTVVVVPPVEKYDIDPNDKESVNRAKEETFKMMTAKH